MKKVVRILSFAVLLLFLLIPIQVKAAEKQMYCLYNPANKEYLYTVDENERNNLLSVWEDKGVICSLPAYSNTPVYRLYDPMSTQHLYTSDDSEITKLVSEGWKKEGIAYYVDDAHTVPIYRLFKSSTGEHQFAGDANSIAALEKEGWIKEGVAWYALSTLTEGNTSEKKETIDIPTGDRYRLEDDIKPKEDGYGGWVIGEARDNKGNYYSRALYASRMASRVYYLNSEYKYLTGIIAAASWSDNAKEVHTIHIFGMKNGEWWADLIFSDENVTSNTSPYNILVDVSDMKSISIYIDSLYERKEAPIVLFANPELIK